MLVSFSKIHRLVIGYDQDIGFKFLPNITVKFPGYLFKTNKQGFRSDWDFEQKRSDKPRILFFGDSLTAGDGVENAKRFSDLIAPQLGCETYNLAQSGSGTDQQLLIKEKYNYEADLIVFCIYETNIERNTKGERTAYNRVTKSLFQMPKPFFKLEQDKLVLLNHPVPKAQIEKFKKTNTALKSTSKSNKVKQYIQNHCPRLSHFLKQCSISILNPQRYPQYKKKNSYSWLLMQALIERFSHNSPTPILIVTIPHPDHYKYKTKPSYIKRFKELEGKLKNCQVVDLLSHFHTIPAEDREKIHLPQDPHLSQFGHKLVAQFLEKHIEKHSAFKQKAPKAKKIKKPKTKKILGISCFFHNSAAALIEDGLVVAAAEEERFTRIKHDNRFPLNAINYCLEERVIDANDLDAICYYENPQLALQRFLFSGGMTLPKEYWMEVMSGWVLKKLRVPELIRKVLNYRGIILQNQHHRSHAASTFYPSPFEKAAILTIDGVGEWACATLGTGENNKVTLFSQMRFPHSLGLLYSAFTYFTGFKVNSGEYKLMGLAPYGEPVYKEQILNNIVEINEDGSIKLNLDYFNFHNSDSMITAEFDKLFDGPARHKESDITLREMNIAASIQSVTEDIVMKMAQFAHKKTQLDNLCLAGGVALNCVANGKLLRQGPFKEIWIQPAAGDSGGAVGAALDTYFTHFNNKRLVPKSEYNTCLGPKYSSNEIAAFLDSFGYPAKQFAEEEVCKAIAKYISEGKIIGHFFGRMEFGPRALGARSILCDPRPEQIQSTLNLKIKFRESFRPFAPAVLREKVHEYFDLEVASPYMLLVAPVTKERQLPKKLRVEDDLLARLKEPRSDIPAITHLDYSARVQTVAKEAHPRFYQILKEFETLTGYGVLVNTSFNVRGEPIVCTPEDAYACFMGTNIDVLVLENFILLKEEQPQGENQNVWKQDFAID